MIKPPKGNILLIEGKRSDTTTFYSGLIRKGHQVECITTGSVAHSKLSEGSINLVVINAASMHTTGQRICHSIHKQYQNMPVILILDEKDSQPEKSDADIILKLPFTLQKLVNRMRPLLPGEQKNIIKAGPLQLNYERRFVRLKGKQTRLTPRLVTLLRILMERAGEVVERKELFRQVWETEYTDDMRTLDVHISWLRQALGDSPRNPHFIKTVRGFGYRLDI
jgi:DNA-binding response OmpR family regulator